MSFYPAEFKSLYSVITSLKENACNASAITSEQRIRLIIMQQPSASIKDYY